MIVFFDIDGTIVSDETHEIPASAIRAIHAARANGHLMYINTGRTYMNVEQRLRDIGFDGYVCGCGTYILCGGELILNRTMPREICLETARAMHEFDITPVFERSDKFFTDKSLREIGGFCDLKELFRTQGKDLSPDVTDADFGFDKFVAWYDEKSDLDGFKRFAAKYYDFIDRGYGFCELCPIGFSKGTGIEAVCRFHNVNISDTCAIGDSLNDLPMLKAAAVSVAMGESPEKLKNSASFVTKNLSEDGIEYALAHLGLI